MLESVMSERILARYFTYTSSSSTPHIIAIYPNLTLKYGLPQRTRAYGSRCFQRARSLINLPWFAANPKDTYPFKWDMRSRPTPWEGSPQFRPRNIRTPDSRIYASTRRSYKPTANCVIQRRGTIYLVKLGVPLDTPQKLAETAGPGDIPRIAGGTEDSSVAQFCRVN